MTKVKFSSQNGNLNNRLERLRATVTSQYGSCGFLDVQTQMPGDVWVEGVRTSLSNSIYELWVDDILGGPMEARNRYRVYEAASKYYKDINPTEQRYATHRVNPLAATIPSNSITPVQTFIYDWFGDPQLYIGIMAVVAALLTGLDEEESLAEYNKRYIDQGALDLNQLYKTYDGVEIK